MTRRPSRLLCAAMLLAALLSLHGATSVARAAPQNIVSVAAPACSGEGYLNYVNAEAAAFRNPGECVRSAMATGMLLVRYGYAQGAGATQFCFVLYDEITLRLAYLGGSNDNRVYTLTCSIYSMHPFEVIATTGTLAAGQDEIVSVQHLDIVGEWYWSDGDQMFFPGWPVSLGSGSQQA